MKLKKFQFTEHENAPQEWKLRELYLGDSNLLVGKNASGKSRTLNVISCLAECLKGERKLPINGDYLVEYEDDGAITKYELKYDNSRVLHEILTINNVPKLTRKSEIGGTIWSDQLDRNLDIRPPETELAVVAKRDSLQHPFLESLHKWGESLRHYRFGLDLGKDLLFAPSEKDGIEYDQRAVSRLFKFGTETYPDRFADAVVSDMQRIGYAISSIVVEPPTSLHFKSVAAANFLGISVREDALDAAVDQFSMSAGMFRALSILIHFNYAFFAKNASCVLIDDIGEGLDFERSRLLINILRDKAKASSVQLVMTSNDRFVMNEVPLEEWTILSRKGSLVTAKSIHNFKQAFDEFAFTGLSNFDFFATDYLEQPEE